MSEDEPQEFAEQLDDEQMDDEPRYGRADESVDPMDEPMAVGETGPDHPDPLSLAEREEQRGWRAEDREASGASWLDSASASEDVEREAVADEWRTVPDPSAEEEAVHEAPPPRYREPAGDPEWELEVSEEEAREEPRDPEETDPGLS